MDFDFYTKDGIDYLLEEEEISAEEEGFMLGYLNYDEE